MGVFFRQLLIMLCTTLCSISILFAQEESQDTVMIFEQKLILNPDNKEFTKFKFGGLFQARFLSNFKEGVDIEGKHHADNEGSNNSFDLKRMRVFMNANITEKLQVTTLVNLADFKSSNPSPNILENAFARYTFNRYLQVTVGQFRPLFGLEATYPADILKSIDYSNAYYLLGNNGWKSFQVGVALTGNVDLASIPMSYGLSVTNGNSKNKIDGDDGKHYSSRLLFNLNKSHNFNVGVSGGIGEVEKKSVYMAGIEAMARLPINKSWSFDFQTEVTQGTNHYSYFKLDLNQRLNPLKDYLIKSFYVLPNLRYELDGKYFHALEFACRYEYLDADAKLNSNARQSWVPMLSIAFLKEYAARIQVGMQLDRFDKKIENSTFYDSNLAFIQFQCRF